MLPLSMNEFTEWTEIIIQLSIDESFAETDVGWLFSGRKASWFRDSTRVALRKLCSINAWPRVIGLNHRVIQLKRQPMTQRSRLNYLICKLNAQNREKVWRNQSKTNSQKFPSTPIECSFEALKGERGGNFIEIPRSLVVSGIPTVPLFKLYFIKLIPAINRIAKISLWIKRPTAQLWCSFSKHLMALNWPDAFLCSTSTCKHRFWVNYAAFHLPTSRNESKLGWLIFKHLRCDARASFHPNRERFFRLFDALIKKRSHLNSFLVVCFAPWVMIDVVRVLRSRITFAH